MDHVGVDIDSKVAANGAGGSIKRVGGAHKGAHLGDSGEAGNDHLDDRTARHKVAETAKEGLVGQMGVVLLDGSALERRTKPEAPSPIPIVASALKLDLPNYAPEECPICKEGKLPLVHLGSRKMKQEAKQTL